MNLVQFVHALEEILPPDTAMEGDRIGLQLQSGREDIASVFITMEVTDSVVEEAITTGCDCIVAFHPLIFAPLASLRSTERVGRLCTKLIQHGIALVVAHTNFDTFPQGTSALLAERLELTVESRLIDDPKRPGFGMGVVAHTTSAIAPQELLERVATVCRAPLRYTEGRAERINRLAIVGGSGSSFIGKALTAQVDAYITADVKYHDFHRVRGSLWLIDPGHYEMEQFVAKGLQAVVEAIARNCGGISVVQRSQVLPNPVQYYPDTGGYQQAQLEYLTD